MTSRHTLTNAAADRITKKIYISSGQMKFTYQHLVHILDTEGYRMSIVRTLVNHWFDHKDIGSMAAVARVCASEAAEANTVLKSLHNSMRDLNDHCEEQNNDN
jgi:hypothetical protein